MKKLLPKNIGFEVEVVLFSPEGCVHLRTHVVGTSKSDDDTYHRAYFCAWTHRPSVCSRGGECTYSGLSLVIVMLVRGPVHCGAAHKLTVDLETCISERRFYQHSTFP